MRVAATLVGRKLVNLKVLETLHRPKTRSLALLNPHYSFQRFFPFLSFLIFHDAKNANHQFTHFSSLKISKHEKTKEQKNHVKQQAKPREVSRRTFCVLTLQSLLNKRKYRKAMERDGELKGPFGCRTTRRRVVLVEIINVLWAVCTVSSHRSRNVRVNQIESEN